MEATTKAGILFMALLAIMFLVAAFTGWKDDR